MRVTTDVLDGLLRPPAAKPRQPTSRERAAANRLRVLQTVAEHGHLRCADLATCWPGARYADQMAQRTVRGLVESGELMPRRSTHGGLSYVLTRPGACALQVRGIAARHGLDLASVSGSTFAHFCLTSRWALHKRQDRLHRHGRFIGLVDQPVVPLAGGAVPLRCPQKARRGSLAWRRATSIRRWLRRWSPS